jgi:sarcosine oxidase subunit alpha
MNRWRLPTGGIIDRARPVRFTFDGRSMVGYAGDTLASALLANGVHLVGRSFKYHRPRGIMAASAEEPNALVTAGRSPDRMTPNLRATQVEIHDGLVAESQNRSPCLRFDAGAVNDLLAPFFPAGFYYKTFMWPSWGWRRIYEPAIRAMAGLGRAPRLADPDHYAQRYAHCDVLVIGGGPAGLAAAMAAAESGRRVILCDEQPSLGGSMLDLDPGTEDGKAAAGMLQKAMQSLSRLPDVTVLCRTTAFGIFAQNFAALAQRVTDHVGDPEADAPRERLWQVRARHIVVATGAIERPAVFPGNDRPGIMLAGAARTYLRRYAVRVGHRAVVVTNNDAAYAAALELASAGVHIAAIADQRAAPGASAAAARDAGIDVLADCRVHGTTGRLRITGVVLAQAGAPRTTRIACDTLLMSAGYTPTVHLYAQARGGLRFNDQLGAFVPDDALATVHAAGACRGVFGWHDAMKDGADAARYADHAGSMRTAGGAAPAYAARAETPPRAYGRAFVDFQNDVTTKDLALAVREGFHSVEHVKRYTTVGMATDQGKTSNINALGLVAGARGTTLPQAGLTMFRMPYTPVSFGTLAGSARGSLFDPVRETPLHAKAAAQGAVFEDVGQWRRSRYFPRADEDMSQAVMRECLAVRERAGLFDASTLGKIDVAGPDAAIFLERLYVNGFRKLAPGRARYGLLLREDGFILDDGVIGRVSENRFHVTTTTGGAARVLAMMEDYLQTEWPDLQVWLTSSTDEWGVIALQGPRARDILAPLVEGIDLTQSALPHMALAEGHICGVPLRLFRVSFTGELGFELNVPADYAAAVWEAFWPRCQEYGAVVYGTETMHLLRAEKGYIIVGQETDGTATPDDVGLGWAVNKAKGDFVGKRSLMRGAMADPKRRQLVGLLTENPSLVPEEGSQIVSADDRLYSLGHVTSAYASATLGRSIALGMVQGGRARLGETLLLATQRGPMKIRVVSPVFHDPAGERLNG